MALRYRVFLLSVMLLTLVGCGSRAFGGGATGTEAITEVEIVRELQFVEEDGSTGPLYTLTMTVPEGWVGSFETLIEQNKIIFDYIVPDPDEEEDEAENVAVADTDEADDDELDRRQRAQILRIEALSSEQYWQQIGSYPGDFTNIVFTGDTYFIYYVPKFAYFAGLSEDVFEPLVEGVPSVISSFEAQRESLMAIYEPGEEE